MVENNDEGEDYFNDDDESDNSDDDDTSSPYAIPPPLPLLNFDNEHSFVDVARTIAGCAIKYVPHHFADDKHVDHLQSPILSRYRTSSIQFYF